MGKAENDQLRASSRARPDNSMLPQGSKDLRRETRYMVSWRVAVSVNGQEWHYGRVKDISLHGAAILNELNLKPGTRVTLSIHMPTLNRLCEPKVLIVHGTIAYTAHDTSLMCFRSGISFAKFEQESDKAYLEERLASNHVKVPDYVCRRGTDRVM
ncbi:MAG: PilZ domain-containing protein [Gallionella sp.]|nr:PilZ domain-containing protein [Gallionella sp.]